jgi:BirA family biotin operon repressor/biotin-[acetyl-CoA-carboxylase] ligase
MFTGMAGERARAQLAGTRFADVRWNPETGSTNADVIALARDGAAEGLVLVTDHQTAGRGRRDRVWEAPPGAGLLLSILLRPPSRVLAAETMAVAVAAAEAVDEVTGATVRLKWPNDLVWPGDGTAPDRKLAGILAEADWPPGADVASGPRRPAPDERAVVVVGIGINANWPDELPEHLAESAVALNHIVGGDVDREALLVALLRRLDGHDARLRADGPAALLEAWRARSATLGRRVRVDLGADEVVGTATDITDEGHLVIATDEGDTREVAVGDVVHLR